MLNTQSLELISTKEVNMPTVRISEGSKSYMLYSKYNPSRDAQAFADEAYDNTVENYIIYGLGLGYHINALENILKIKNKSYHIYIVECNKEVFNLATEHADLGSILANENMTLFIMKNGKKDYERFSNILSLENIKLVIHRPSLNVIPEEFTQLKYLLEEHTMKQNSIRAYGSVLDRNFEINIKNFNHNVDILFGKYKNIPLYLVSAGPSLDKNINELSKVKSKGIILSVGRAVRSLLEANIIPDYIIITDSSDFVYDRQLKDLDIEIPIIVLSTCDHNVMLKYKGIKHIALQQGYNPAEAYAKVNKHQLVRTGGSVATTGLDVAIRMGCNPIVFVGQDLAFTDNKTHSATTFSKDVSSSHSLREVEDIYGRTTYTPKNLYIYLRWIQSRVAEEKHIEFIDATEGGAKIKGTRVMNLRNVVL